MRQLIIIIAVLAIESAAFGLGYYKGRATGYSVGYSEGDIEGFREGVKIASEMTEEGDFETVKLMNRVLETDLVSSNR